jgi:acyl-CoA synthetase (AMP-forming)/AMP-acid ligase II
MAKYMSTIVLTLSASRHYDPASQSTLERFALHPHLERPRTGLRGEALDHSNVGDLLDDCLARHGDRPLLNFFELGHRLSLRRFADETRRFAAFLQSRGVGLGTPVAVVSPNVPAFPVAWFALMRLGAVLVPINPRYTEDEMRFVLGDSNAAFVLAERTHAGVIERASLGLIDTGRHIYWEGSSLEPLWAGGRPEQMPDATEFRPVPVLPDDAAGIHYTSGTTGFPKGCVLSHRTWLVAAASKDCVMPERPARILTDAPFFYIDAPAELIMAIQSGAEQCVAERPSLSKFARWLVDLDIDYAEVWEALADRVFDPESEERLRSRGRTLYGTTFGLRAGRQAALEKRLNAKLRECFGMTECGLATAQRFDDDREVDSGSCGVATAHRETRVVNPLTEQDVAADEIGELWVRGPGMLLRYHNRPDANRESFRPGGWFRTGDLARRDERGSHFIVGRVKDMIRRSHENIAANEVESVIGRIEGVAEVAVVGVADPFRGEEVKAFVVLGAGAGPEQQTPRALREQAASSLASFKVPRYWEFVPELPLTPSGKIKKVALKEMDAAGPFGWDAETDTWRNR